MHHIQSIQAIATEPTFSVQAALATREVVGCRSMMAAADIHPVGKMSLAEVDRKLGSSRLRPADRIQVKLALSRAGLLLT